MAQEKHKIIVAGLPKTGTSTLAVMLRMLGYSVTGPNPDFRKGDKQQLETMFNSYNGFQDYPWCFEWEHFLPDPDVKFIVLYRDPQSWWKSFFDSYGKGNGNYLSLPYFNLKKVRENKPAFLEYYNNYYKELNGISCKYEGKFLFVNIKTITWKQLCVFLQEPIPTNLWGKEAKVPHVNKKNFKRKTRKLGRSEERAKNILWKVLGQDIYFKLSNFVRKIN